MKKIMIIKDKVLIADFDWKLHPSSAEIWTHCPRAAQAMLCGERVERGVSEDGSAAAVGTAKHAIAADLIKEYVESGGNEKALKKSLDSYYEINTLNKNEIDTILNSLTHFIHPGVTLWIENPLGGSLSLDNWGKIIFGGIADLVIFDGDSLTIFDWKFGAIPVRARGNKQLSLYARAFRQSHGVFLDAFPNSKIRLVIAQPSKGGDASIEATDEVCGEEELRIAWKYNHSSRMSVTSGGAWCRFCSLLNICRAGGKFERKSKEKVASADDFE